MKIIATIGPSSMKSQVLRQLITSGLESIRLNFSHFHDEEFDKIVAEVRNSNKKVEIIGDLRGRKVRVSEIVFSTYKIHMEDIVYFCGEDMYNYLLKDKRILKNLIPLNINSKNINKYKVNKISLYFNDIQYTAAPSADKNGWYAPYFDSSVSYNKN